MLLPTHKLAHLPTGPEASKEPRIEGRTQIELLSMLVLEAKVANRQLFEIRKYIAQQGETILSLDELNKSTEL